jgi:hypothetical protein
MENGKLMSAAQGMKEEERGEFRVSDGGERIVQVRAVVVQDTPEPPGRVLMEEEVFATWAATSLIVAVMGTQFTGRSGISDKVRVPLDLVTMIIASLILLWAALSYFGILPHKYRSIILVFLIACMLALFILVMVLVAKNRV